MVFTQFGLAASCVRSSVTLSNMHEQEPRHEVVRAAILEVVENQIRDDKPPETRQTIERLQSEGCSPGEARAIGLLGCFGGDFPDHEASGRV